VRVTLSPARQRAGRKLSNDNAGAERIPWKKTLGVDRVSGAGDAIAKNRWTDRFPGEREPRLLPVRAHGTEEPEEMASSSDDNFVRVHAQRKYPAQED